MSKRQWASFSADYSPDLQFASVCVNYHYYTQVRVRGYNVAFIFFRTVMEELLYISVLIDYSRVSFNLGG